MLIERYRTHTLTVERIVRTHDGQGGWTEALEEQGTVTGSLQPGGAGEDEAGGQERAKADWMLYADPGVDVMRDDVLGGRFKVLWVKEWDAASDLDNTEIGLEEIQKGR